MTRDGATRAWFVRIPGHGMKGSNLRATRRGILLHVEDTRNSRMAASPFHPRHKTLKPKPIQHVLSYFSSHTKQTLTSVPIHFKLRNNKGFKACSRKSNVKKTPTRMTTTKGENSLSTCSMDTTEENEPARV
jgi:hypothetical protein